jgi:hypothetical protein
MMRIITLPNQTGVIYFLNIFPAVGLGIAFTADKSLAGTAKGFDPSHL